MVVQLLEAFSTELERRQVALAQTLLPVVDDRSPEILQAARFERLTELCYLVQFDVPYTKASSDMVLPVVAARGPWPAAALVPVLDTAADEARLESILARTYEGTRDCPRLNGVRHSADVLAGYRSLTEAGARPWWFAVEGDRVVGCLLLAEHAHPPLVELVYMGIVPEARGHGWGRRLVQFCQAWRAGRAVTGLIVAVDLENQPALAVYQAAGLVEWERRVVWARLLGTARAPDG